MNDFIEKQQELATQEIVAYALGTTNWEADLDPIREVIQQIIHNTGEELLRLVSGLEEEYQNDPLAVAAGMEDIKLNAVEDIKQHITSVTGAK